MTGSRNTGLGRWPLYFSFVNNLPGERSIPGPLGFLKSFLFGYDIIFNILSHARMGWECFDVALFYQRPAFF
jgi:hypothetical protein